MDKFIQIAIDGPAAAGKSTIAKIMAQKLGYVYVDTGAMYRAITWASIHHDVDLDNEKAIMALLSETRISLAPGGKVSVNNVDVTEQIREPDVTANVSKIATYESIREALKARQIALADAANVIMDGRDIGTHVLPDADFKFFMVADPKVRAQRRHEENRSRGIASDLVSLEADIKKRDEMDANRKHAPLKQANDAILIDTSALSIHEVVDKMVGFVLK
ncbi:MAG: (d)CMP kinase [Defluviitaleaceae bacterium]|nr:(d)CMP kinase [Defluviitaleaceae bacterium]